MWYDKRNLQWFQICMLFLSRNVHFLVYCSKKVQHFNATYCNTFHDMLHALVTLLWPVAHNILGVVGLSVYMVNTQHEATCYKRVVKCPESDAPNNVAICHIKVLQLFCWGFTCLILQTSSSSLSLLASISFRSFCCSAAKVRSSSLRLFAIILS